MKVWMDRKSQQNRATWVRGHRRMNGAINFDRRPSGPPLSFRVLMERVTRNVMSRELADRVLRMPSDRVVLEIEFDRETGLVSNYHLRFTLATVANGTSHPDEPLSPVA